LWLGDGKGLVITAGEPDATYLHQIWFVSYPSGEARKITNDVSNYVGLSLTADSSAIVTGANRASAKYLGSPEWRCGSGHASNFQPGRRIGRRCLHARWQNCLTPQTRTTSGSLLLVNADGSGQKQIMTDAKAVPGLSVSSGRTLHSLYINQSLGLRISGEWILTAATRSS
jgi:hypothetical protein